MNWSTKAALATEPAQQDDRVRVDRLMLFFAIVYVVEGIGQVGGGIIGQPLTYYLKDLGWSPVAVTAYLAVPSLPWIIKPVFGLVSDFLPLFGSRRKAYLLLSSVGAVIGFAIITELTSPARLMPFMLLTAYGMAIASTICGALLVENGQRYKASSAFVGQQWLWFNIAAVATSIGGGELVQHLSPAGALHAAAAIAAVAPLSVLAATLLLLDETPTRLQREELRATWRSLIATLTSGRLWLIAGFLFLYYFSPGFYTPLYYYMTDTLHFSQSYIGILGGIASVGWIVAALVHRWWMRGIGAVALLNLSILLGTVSTLAFLLLRGETSAALVNFFSGFAAMIANVATLTLAADYCPKRSEGFAFAALMGVINLAAPVSNTVGAWLYERVFSNQLVPLIFVSAAATAFAFVLVPLLRLGKPRSGLV